MNRKSLFGILGVLCIIASVAMYMIGKNSANLSELKDFWWMPLPLGALCLLEQQKVNKKTVSKAHPVGLLRQHDDLLKNYLVF